MKRALVFALILFAAFLFCEEAQEFREEVRISYVIYEGFYLGEAEAKENIELMKSFNFKGLKIVKKKVAGQIKFGIKVGETDSYTKKTAIVKRLKQNRFGALVYQKKRTVKIPITAKEKEKKKEEADPEQVKKKKTKALNTKLQRRKKLKKAGLIKKDKGKIPVESFVSAGLAVALGGVSYMFYSQADDHYSDYMDASDPSELLGLWDGVKVNEERFKVYMSASISLGVFSVYQMIWGSKARPDHTSPFALGLSNRRHTACLSLKLRY